jgi:hypothetical protein
MREDPMPLVYETGPQLGERVQRVEIQELFIFKGEIDRGYLDLSFPGL